MAPTDRAGRPQAQTPASTMPVGERSADATPLLSARESPLLLLEERPRTFPLPLRRKSSLPPDALATAAAAARPPTRQRGASVPPSMSASATSSSSGGSFAPGCLSRAESLESAAAESAASAASAAGGDAGAPLGPPPSAAARRRGFTLSRKFLSSRREEERERPARRRVTFKTALHAEVAPCPALLSYDELLFNVAGLYQTTDFLLEPEDGDEPGGSGGDAPPPLERSVPLMIAEFLYRSAMYLGYPAGDKPWLPGFREDKRFSTNDVRRWRRLAHFDWVREDREFERQQRRSRQRRGLARSDSASSADSADDCRVDGPALPSTAVALPSEAPARSRSRDRLRAAVSRMASLSSRRRHARRRRHGDGGGESADDESADDGAESAEDSRARGGRGRRTRKKKGEPRAKVDMEHPPPVDPRLAASGELAPLVAIVNSCVYCGAFRFRARDVVSLCNVDIDGA